MWALATEGFASGMGRRALEAERSCGAWEDPFPWPFPPFLQSPGPPPRLVFEGLWARREDELARLLAALGLPALHPLHLSLLIQLLLPHRHCHESIGRPGDPKEPRVPREDRGEASEEETEGEGPARRR